MLIGSFYRKHVKLLPIDRVPSAILNNPKFFPYFKDCRGAIDGSQFHSWVQEEATVRCRNRKGFISQNVLAICDWMPQFLYILSGWEGSAADSRVFEYACRNDLYLPRGFYFLADAGFPLCDMLMTPYRGVRYHLKEWKSGNQRWHVCHGTIFLYLMLSSPDHRITKNFSIFATLLLVIPLSVFLEFLNVNSACSRQHQSIQLICRQCLSQLSVQFTTLTEYMTEALTIYLMKISQPDFKGRHQTRKQSHALLRSRNWDLISQQRKGNGPMRDVIELQKLCGQTTKLN